MQALNGLSDREAAVSVTFDLRGKAARGYAVAEPGFHPTILTSTGAWPPAPPAGTDLRGHLGSGRPIRPLTGKTRRAQPNYSAVS